MNSTKKLIRHIGLLYLALIMLAPYGLLYVSSEIWVRGDTAATINNLLSKSFLFRTGIASNLISEVLLILIAWLLYRLFKQVNAHQAKLMAIFAIVSVPISFLGNVFKMTALKIVETDRLRAFDTEQINDLSILLLTIGNYCGQMVQIYWGLWLIPFGLLVYKSKLIPRLFGTYLILGGVAYICLGFTFILIPEYSSIAFKLALPFFFSEIAIMICLLIIGIKEKPLLNEWESS